MNLEPGEVTGFWLGREGGGWAPVDGIASIELDVEDTPVEDTTALATEFGVTKIVSWAPTCPVGIHLQHPDLTCEEYEELSQSFRYFLEHLVAEAFAQAARRAQAAMDQFIDGLSAWGPRGLLASLDEPYEPTPIERALQILAPHLADLPLYQPKVLVWTGRRVSNATDSPAPEAGQPSAAAAPDRPAWQSPYGPPPRRR